MSDPSRLRIPLATFKRVFDTDPAREVVTLPELIATLTRFELKPEVQRRIERELERAEVAWRQVRAGEHASGRYARRLGEAREAALIAGGDPVEAVDVAWHELKKDTTKRVKQDIRLWSPALFKAGGRRQQEDVTHVSCLVMDHDDGTPIDVVREVWAPWFHIVHTTWSHRPEFPRFRVIVPLAQAVEAERWEAVYAWAIDRSEGVVDPTGKGRASTFAMPVVPSATHPREAYSHAGALLDPVAEGVLDANQPPDDATLAAIVRPSPSFTGDPERQYIDAGVGSVGDDDPFDDQALWDAVAGGTAEVTSASPPANPPTRSASGAAPLIDRLEAWMEQVAPAALAVDALERLEGLRDRGTLTDEEFEDAKAAILADLRVHTPPWVG